jgi:hypothetical protein
MISRNLYQTLEQYILTINIEVIIMSSTRGLALLIPGIVFFVGFALANSFMDGAVKIVLILLPTVAILAGVALLCPGNKHTGV